MWGSWSGYDHQRDQLFREVKRAVVVQAIGGHLRFRVFDLASHAPDQTLFCVLFIAAWSGGNRPDHLAILMLWTFVHAGVTGVATHGSFLTVQQLTDLRLEIFLHLWLMALDLYTSHEPSLQFTLFLVSMNWKLNLQNRAGKFYTLRNLAWKNR